MAIHLLDFIYNAELFFLKFKLIFDLNSVVLAAHS